MKKDAGEITKMISDREKDFNSLYDIMDKDLDLRELSTTPNRTDYDSAIRGKTNVHQTDVEVFSNRPCTFADAVQSILMASEMQIMVRMAEEEGEDKRDDMARLERLFNFVLYKGDERLRRLLLPPLKLSIIEASLSRGGAAGRFVIYKSKNGIVADFLSYDPRWLSYDVGGEGVLWSGYKTFRSGASIESEYGFKATKAKDNEVVDFWEDDKGNFINSVICENQFLKEPTEVRKELGYELPSMPILIMPVPNRTPLRKDSNNPISWGESIFAPGRNTFALRNRFATIVATHARLMAQQPAINYKDESGVEITDTSYYAGAVLNLNKGHNELVPSPLKEISSTVVDMLNWLNNEVEDATLPRLNLSSLPASGTALNLIQEASNKVFNPQLYLLNNFYSDICHLIEEQLLASKIKVKIQGQDKNKYYEAQITPVDLKRPHKTTVEFTARTPWRQLDVAQQADMLRRQGLPDGFIQEYILKVPDPKGMADLKAIEMYENSPKGSMLRAWVALKKLKREDEANQIARDLAQIEMQEQAQATTSAAPTQPTETPAETPEMGGGI